MTVRTRFAPSPTGYLHIGGARTALFNWMLARRHGGAFFVRIEDTDQKRSVPGAVDNILESLRWLGIEWDEGPDIGGPYGPYVQTERAALYQQWGHWLVEQGRAYKCFCTAAQLAAMRAAQQAAGKSTGYDRRCRHLSAAAVVAREAAGESCVVRLKMPLDGQTVIPDLIRGDIVFQNTQLNDEVLLKSDGLPTYHLAQVVDDHFMATSHIMRGDEWINTAPIHVNLFRAFGWPLPIFAHLPVILNPSGKGKLSKRTQAFNDQGQRALVRAEEFQKAGYLPAAVVNFLANVGWTFGEDREKFPIEEAIARFDLADVNPAPTQLPYSKLDWLNGQYIQEMAPLDLARAVRPFLEAAGLEVNVEALLLLMPAMSVRLKRLTDAVEFLRFLSEDAPLQITATDLTDKNLDGAAALPGLRQARQFIQQVEPFTVESLKAGLTAVGETVTANGKAGPFLGKLRLAVTGQRVSPPLFESMVALGRERVGQRLAEAEQILALAHEAA
jgi:glutamyl-tRNA synthetase